MSNIEIQEVRFDDFALEQARDYMPGPEVGKVIAETGTFAVLGIVAAGKGTVAESLIRDGFAAVAISDTTRDIKDRDRMNPSDPESYPTAYNFWETRDMVGKILAREMVEVAPVHGNIYGTPLDALKKVAASAKRPMLEIDIQGVQKIHTIAPEMPSFFITVSNVPTWLERWAGRDSDITEEEFTTRVKSAISECSTAVKMAFDGQLILIANHSAELAAESVKVALEDGIVANQAERILALRDFTEVITNDHGTGRLWEDFQHLAKQSV